MKSFNLKKGYLKHYEIAFFHFNPELNIYSLVQNLNPIFIVGAANIVKL